MQPRITVITIGVDDLERSLRFYRDGLGLATEGIIGKKFEHGAVAFFDLQAGLKLAIWPRKSVSHDSGIPLSRPSPTEFTLGHNVSSKAEVDAVMEEAKNAGAVIVKLAQETFWGGYAGYFKDPDNLPIPLIPATHSGGFRTPVPIHFGHLFRRIPATLPGGGDAGVKRSNFCQSIGRFLVVGCPF